MNIASVPMPVRPELHRRPGAEVLGRGEQFLRVEHRHRMAPGGVGHHADGLGQVRGAGGEEHHAAGAYQPDRGGEQFALQLAQRGVRRPVCAASALRPAAQCTQPGAGRVDEHAVETACRQGGSRPSARTTSTGSPRVFSSTMSARRWLVRRRSRPPPLRGDRGDQRGFAAGAGAQVQPASPPSPPAHGRASAQVPPAGCPRPGPVPGRHAPRPADPVAAAEVHRIRRVLSGRAADLGCRSALSTPGRAARCTAGRRRRRPVRRPVPRVGAERVGEGLAIQRGWECTKAARPTGSASADGASSATQEASSRLAMARSTALTNPARAESNSTGLFHGGRHRGHVRRRWSAAVGRHPAAASSSTGSIWSTGRPAAARNDRIQQPQVRCKCRRSAQSQRPRPGR